LEINYLLLPAAEDKARVNELNMIEKSDELIKRKNKWLSPLNACQK
jgi:hypothetical protein